MIGAHRQLWLWLEMVERECETRASCCCVGSSCTPSHGGAKASGSWGLLDQVLLVVEV